MQGVGKVVSYTNADRILPRELLDAIHPIPAYQQGQGQEHRRHHGEDLHQVVLLDGQLGLIGLPQLGHGLPQGAARPEQGAVRETSRRRSRAQTGGRILPLRQDHL